MFTAHGGRLRAPVIVEQIHKSCRTSTKYNILCMILLSVQ